MDVVGPAHQAQLCCRSTAMAHEAPLFGWGIAGESLARPLAGLTTAAPFGLVPLLGGVVMTLTPFLSLPFSG
uniref:Uncharacterized protein n=1 Tax=Oryza punctata TaxID=4537 RepID=A0A0E0KCF9_ORYPU